LLFLDRLFDQPIIVVVGILLPLLIIGLILI
jgi:hypothetical protein